MPKISAPTVIEHHDRQLTLLISAATDLLRHGGPDALTLASLAKHVGRSRASLYVYFGSTQDLLVTVCEYAIATWAHDITSASASAPTPADRLATFVRAQVTASPDPLLDAALRIAGSALSDEHRERIERAQVPLVIELLDILTSLEVEPPERAAFLVQGAVAAAHDQVTAGADPDAVNDVTTEFIRAGIAQIATTPDAPTHRLATARRSAADDRATTQHGASGALAFSVAPSLPLLFASVVREATATPGNRPIGPAVLDPAAVVVASARLLAVRRRTRATVVGLLGWAIAAFIAGLAGLGAAAVHIGLGLVLVGLAFAAIPTLSRTSMLRTLSVIIAVAAAATSAVALIGGSQRWTTGLHILLATGLLVGVAQLVRVAWNARLGFDVHSSRPA